MLLFIIIKVILWKGQWFKVLLFALQLPVKTHILASYLEYLLQL